VFAVAVERLVKVFRSRAVVRRKPPVTAVDGITFDVRPGEIYALLGPNGAGKTTTIKMIAGLVTPTSGTATVRQVGGGGGMRRPPRLGSVLEGSRNTYWRLTPMENLMYFGSIRGVGKAALIKRARELLAFFDLTEKANAHTQTLSRGMQQKLAVAVALVHDPDVLLLDEPTLGLDVGSSRLVQERLKQLVKEQGKAVLLTTHQMDVAGNISDRVAIINHGKIAAEDTVAGLRAVFEKQDYLVEISAADFANVKPRLDGWKFIERESDAPGRARLIFRLDSAAALYPLMDIMRAEGATILNLAHEVPSLEDIFLEIVNSDVAEGGKA
jgi:ABC-2 type transport system ATP-binding protein